MFPKEYDDRNLTKKRVLRAFGMHLSKLRKHKTLTQEVLAEKSGTSAKYINEIEQGRRNPSLHILYRLMTALELTGDDLLEPFHKGKDQDRKKQIAEHLRQFDKDTKFALIAIKFLSEAEEG